VIKNFPQGFQLAIVGRLALAFVVLPRAIAYSSVLQRTIAS
jgi:hypothetical protein